MSVFDYCCPVWANVSNSELSKVKNNQKKAARIILKRSNGNSAMSLFNDLKWLSFDNRLNYHIGVMTYKIINEQTPKYMCVLRCPSCVIRKLFSSPEHEVLKYSFVILQWPSSVRQQFLKTTSPLKPLIGFWPNFTGMIPGWSPIKVVQTVSVDCISRSQGQKIGFQNAIFKNLLVWNFKAQSFHIWYVASSRGPLLKLFKLCPWGQNWPSPAGSQFYIELYKEKFKRHFLLNR